MGKGTGGKKTKSAPQTEAAKRFVEVVDAVTAQLRETLVATYARKTTGAFAYGSAGLVSVASELMANAKSAQDLFNASTFMLSAVLSGLGAYGLEGRPQGGGG
mgnify:FL=1